MSRSQKRPAQDGAREQDESGAAGRNETALKRAVTRYLELCGWIVTRAQAGNVRKGVQLAKAGTADLVCCANGAYVEVELKTATGKLRLSQETRRAAVVARGGKYFVVRSVADAEGVVREMQS